MMPDMRAPETGVPTAVVAPPAHQGGHYPSSSQQQAYHHPAAQGAARKAGSTQISDERPEGTPSFRSTPPPVHIMEARDEEPPSLVWYGVVALSLVTVAFGLLVGYLLASSGTAPSTSRCA